jgi:hypothetical protein
MNKDTKVSAIAPSQTHTKQPVKFIVSPVTTFNEDEELWETKVGREGKDMPLVATFYGNTEKESKKRAEAFCKIMNVVDYVSNDPNPIW